MIGVLINLFQKWKLYSILKYVRREGVKKWKKRHLQFVFLRNYFFKCWMHDENHKQNDNLMIFTLTLRFGGTNRNYPHVKVKLWLSQSKNSIVRLEPVEECLRNMYSAKRTMLSHWAWRQFLLDKNKQRFCFSQAAGFRPPFLNL